MKKISQLALAVLIISLFLSDISFAATSVSIKKVTAKPVIAKVIPKKKTPVKSTPKQPQKQQPIKQLNSNNNSVTPLPKKQDISKQIKENKLKLLQANNILSNKAIISKIKPVVVYIETKSGSGSGIIIEQNGYILTNAHVVTGVDTATVKLFGNKAFAARVIGRDEAVDFALLKIEANDLSTADLGNSDNLEQGDDIYTLGYPFGLEGDVSFKEGTVSRRHEIDGIPFIEISAEIHPGNSGGPLVDQSGQVVGINSLAIGSGKIKGVIIGESLKFALPINLAKSMIPALKAGKNIIVPKQDVAQDPLPSPQPQDSRLAIERCRLQAKKLQEDGIIYIVTGLMKEIAPLVQQINDQINVKAPIFDNCQKNNSISMCLDLLNEIRGLERQRDNYSKALYDAPQNARNRTQNAYDQEYAKCINSL